jgi:hypothetical protein
MSKTDMARSEEPAVYTPECVVAIRTNIAKASQAVFASLLDVSVSTVQRCRRCLAGRQSRCPPNIGAVARAAKRRVYLN